MKSTNTDNDEQVHYYLFGYPISHSASPAFHNHIFSSSSSSSLKTYRLHPLTHVTSKMRELCRAKDFGGASVTMPIKVQVMDCGLLDEVAEEGKVIGAVNTIVPVPTGENGTIKLVGTNTDWLGILNSILPHITSPGGAGLVIGAGGTSRAAIYALQTLNISPIYLLNRDEAELQAVLEQFQPYPDIANRLSIVQNVEPVITAAPTISIVIGCIPAFKPETPSEAIVDTVARRILSSPHTSQRVFLEMCYKPRVTPLMIHAQSFDHNNVVSGIEAMLEQGFAQQRMWKKRDANWESARGVVLPAEVEDTVRTLIREMQDVQPDPNERPIED